MLNQLLNNLIPEIWNTIKFITDYKLLWFQKYRAFWKGILPQVKQNFNAFLKTNIFIPPLIVRGNMLNIRSSLIAEGTNFNFQLIQLCQNIDIKYKVTIDKISFDRRVYQSVDDRGIILLSVSNITECIDPFYQQCKEILEFMVCIYRQYMKEHMMHLFKDDVIMFGWGKQPPWSSVLDLVSGRVEGQRHSLGVTKERGRKRGMGPP